MDAQHDAKRQDGRLFTIKETILSGRGAYATQTLRPGTVILEASDLTISLIYSEYRKEVCGQCFAYDRGTQWKHRDGATGFVFCTEQCRDAWDAHTSQIGREAWSTVHACLQKSKCQDQIMIDQSGIRPTLEEIERQWNDIDADAQRISHIRMSNHNRSDKGFTGKDLAVLRKHTTKPVHSDSLKLFTSVIIAVISDPKNNGGGWSELVGLEDDPTPYHSHFELSTYTISFLQLFSVLPLSMLPHFTKQICQDAVSHAAHNAFSLRSPTDDDEFLGWGVWPSASYFNHSCQPNLRKERHGRTWKFVLQKSVREDEELSISYLGGAEAELGVWQRRMRLDEEWGFICRCVGCNSEEAEEKKDNK